MRVGEALTTVRRVFLDTTPVIYHVQEDPVHWPVTRVVFRAIEERTIGVAFTQITSAECFVLPLRTENPELTTKFKEFFAFLTSHDGRVSLDSVGLEAAELRARHNLRLPDAFQVAAAIAAGCDGFLTNDIQLKRVPGIQVLVLGEMEP